MLGEIRTGTPVAARSTTLAARTGLPVVARFAEGIAVAVERGTPLADVLHAQAGDVREAGRRALIETGARREVLMMVPVVFLVLPATVMFAFWPGVVGLRLVTPVRSPMKEIEMNVPAHALAGAVRGSPRCALARPSTSAVTCPGWVHDHGDDRRAGRRALGHRRTGSWSACCATRCGSVA